MPEGLLIAGAVVGLAGGALGLLTTGWNLYDRVTAARAKAKAREDEREAKDRDPLDGMF